VNKIFNLLQCKFVSYNGYL